jgi:hypothetical protein
MKKKDLRCANVVMLELVSLLVFQLGWKKRKLHLTFIWLDWLPWQLTAVATGERIGQPSYGHAEAGFELSHRNPRLL